MDFKVAGTHEGITAIQMDMKIKGLTFRIIREALEQTRRARLYILDEVMLKCIPEPRKELSKYAPKIDVMQIEIDKIAEVIGPRGKVIKKIVEDTGCEIDTEDDGKIYIRGLDPEMIAKAKEIITNIVSEPEVGKIYHGKVVRIMDFGAFVEIAPGKDGLVHISHLAKTRVNKVEDVVKIGDELDVKLMEIDAQGRLNLSHKDTLPLEPGEVREEYKPRDSRPKRNGGDRGGRRNSNSRDSHAQGGDRRKKQNNE